MLHTIKAFDERLFLYLNSLHNPFFDNVMWLFSDKFFWIPLYAWFLWLLYKKFPTKYWTVLIAVGLMILFTDQFCNLSKHTFMRLRPTHESHLEGIVHTVNNYKGGLYSFYSGHSSNAFAVALFIIITLSAKRRYIIPIALGYAVLTAYSRIYLGVHYPGDILVGAITGSILGTLFAYLHLQARKKWIR